MKRLFLILFMFCVTLLVAQTPASPSMTGTTTPADSANTKYVTQRVTGGVGTLTIQGVFTKVANTGSTVAGYAILQGSLDGTNWVNVKTAKTFAKGAYGGTLPFELTDVDTCTFANQTTNTYTWIVTSNVGETHPYYWYRIAIFPTTTKINGTGFYQFKNSR